MAASRNEILTLHRYFIWANRMRTHLDELLAREHAPGRPDNVWGLSDRAEIEVPLYMGYWYAGCTS
jgi:hypothetical protein